jgi:hypothetical protein
LLATDESHGLSNRSHPTSEFGRSNALAGAHLEAITRTLNRANLLHHNGFWCRGRGFGAGDGWRTTNAGRGLRRRLDVEGLGEGLLAEGKGALAGEEHGYLWSRFVFVVC